MSFCRVAVAACLLASMVSVAGCAHRTASSEEKGLKFETGKGTWDFFWVYSKSFGDIQKPENLHVCVYKATLNNWEYQGTVQKNIFGEEMQLKNFWYKKDREVFRQRAEKFADNYYNVENLKAGFKVRNNELANDPNASRALGIFNKFRNWFFAEITQQRDFLAGNTGRVDVGGNKNDTLEYMDNATSFGDAMSETDIAKIGRNLELILTQTKYSTPTSNPCPRVETVLERLPAAD